MDMREPRLSMPDVPLGIELTEVGPGTSPEEPLTHGIHLLLDLPLGGRAAGETQFDDEPILPGERQRFGVQLAALAHGVFDDRLRPVIEELVTAVFIWMHHHIPPGHTTRAPPGA
jgi:hypothetical protein